MTLSTPRPPFELLIGALVLVGCDVGGLRGDEGAVFSVVGRPALEMTTAGALPS
ncbi:hypothetical protein GGP85_002651 [Salinibacter ruber]|nr:hypothetical protein [Salinibacter ruber]MCS3664814.1 hypothetical protein [Salinibacter ruber]MCS3827183.1 hypothetical protein [Salinibacter ruber]MCS4145764.1 hypothetical protein [Salinibacter ruber]